MGIFQTNNVTCLMDKENASYIPEFIGTEKRLRLQVYKEARMQLANYIDDRIYEAWVEYGRTESIKKWYKKSLLANREAFLTGQNVPVLIGLMTGSKMRIMILKSHLVSLKAGGIR